jgi:hypothetical protein
MSNFDLAICGRCFGAPPSVGAPRDGAVPFTRRRLLAAIARTQTAILGATPLVLGELEFEDALEIVFQMLETSVPLRRTAAGIRAIARASGREARLMEAIEDWDNSHRSGRGPPEGRVMVRAFLRELQGRPLLPEDVPGRPDEAETLATVRDVQSDHGDGDPRERAGLDLRTLMSLGFDVVPLLTSGLYQYHHNVAIFATTLAVALGKREYARVDPETALVHALALGDDVFVAELLEYVDADRAEFVVFQKAHGLATTMTWRPDGRGSWDAQYALACDEESRTHRFLRVGTPIDVATFARLVLCSPPGLRRELLKSQRQPEEVREVLAMAIVKREAVWQWLVEHRECPLRWDKVSEAVRTLSLGLQSLDDYDLNVAVDVLRLLGNPAHVAYAVICSLLRAGLNVRAAELVPVLVTPAKCSGRFYKWTDLMVRALIHDGDETLTAIQRSGEYVASLVNLEAIRRGLLEEGRADLAFIIDDVRHGLEPDSGAPGVPEALSILDRLTAWRR